MESPGEKVKYYYSKRNYSSATSSERKGDWALSRQALHDANLSHASSCNAAFELCAFYQIDHEKLPPKSPIHLKAIRVVKVSEATKLEVMVSFPSTLALRNYFALSPEPGREPELDERFVMSANQAGRILRRPIPSSEMEEQKHLESFWLSTPNLYDSPPAVALTPEVEIAERASPGGHCLLTIKRAGLVGWGIRRKVRYIGRHREMSSPELEEEEVQADDEGEQRASERKRKREAAEEERRKKTKKKKGKKSEEKKKKPRRYNECKGKGEVDQQQAKGSKDRWSSERYEAAELKLLEIMKKKEAVLGKPIMRQALREEARKHIGDTGLLDHLLKHMAGKVVSDGAERFRRRHNAEGAMEYWLEPADLEEVRQQAGVVDPFWVPPPGWKPGDATFACPCGGDCKPEIKRLRIEISILKRDLEQLSSVTDVEMLAKEGQSEADDARSTWQFLVCILDFFILKNNATLRTREANYKCLMERNNKLEEEMSVISNYLQELKEEIRLLKEEMENKRMEIEVTKADKGLQHQGADHGATKQEEIDEKGMQVTDNNANSNNNSSTTNDKSSSNVTAAGTAKTKSATTTTTTSSRRMAARRSGFRVCKPQGTFMWPDMWSSTGSSGGGAAAGGGERCPQGAVVVPGTMVATMMTTAASIEEHLMLLQGGVPTPRSASSATSAPRLLLLPSPTSPVATRAPDAAMTVPSPGHYPHHLRLQQPGGSLDICPPVVYHHMVARVWAQTTTSPTALTGAGSGPEAAAMAASWDAHKGARSSSNNITTDLALATPSITYQ